MRVEASLVFKFFLTEHPHGKRPSRRFCLDSVGGEEHGSERLPLECVHGLEHGLGQLGGPSLHDVGGVDWGMAMGSYQL